MFGQTIEEDEPEYKQQIGLKKMLYKYQHQNQQLKTQIHALTERLQQIMSKKNQSKSQEPSNKDFYGNIHQQILQKQLASLSNQIENVKNQIRISKQRINENKEQKVIKIKNEIINVNQQISKIKHQLSRYENKQTNVIIKPIYQQNYQEKAINLQKELQQLRKNVRQLERTRDSKQKTQLKKHMQYVDLGLKNRELLVGSSPKGKVQEKNTIKKAGIWGMEYSEQNYQKIKESLKLLKEQKNVVLSGIKNQNTILKTRLNQLRRQWEQLQKNTIVSQLPQSTRLSRKQTAERKFDRNVINKSTIQQPQLHLGPISFEQKNDKNFVPKPPRKVEWSMGPTSNGVPWNDSELRSPVTGANLWFEGHLLGLQFLHSLGESSQHLQLPFKKITPIQYRLNANDYLQNLILFLKDNKIIGIQFFSKNGRNDSFGQTKTKGKTFDFNIKGPEKPLYSYGVFSINNKNESCIIKLGFEVI